MPSLEPQHFESLYPATSRFLEIEQALAYIKQGNACQLIALPGVGRSTFLGLLSYNKTVRTKHLGAAEKKFHFVMINFSEVRRRPLFDVTKFLFLGLVDSLRDREFEEAYQQAKTLFQEALVMQDELVLFQGLKTAIDLLTIQRQMTIVFLFDRFEEYIPMLTPEFFANLRVIRNRAKYQFSAIFSLNRPLEESVESSLLTEYYDFLVGHHVYLPLQDEGGTAFRIRYAEQLAAKTLPEKTIKDVATLAGGFTREIKACVQTILRTDESYHTLEELSSLLLTHKTVQRPLYELWQTLSPSEQDFLASGTYQETDLDYPYLSAVGLLKDGAITIPLFARFLHDTLLSAQQKVTTKPAIVFDPEKNQITKGEIVLSDSLTASEFKMLVFFLQYVDQIITKETLISAVWNTAASTAGVTDQAVDQLIFRLRKKIEEDPNNPTHLQTVKGRGYKFIA